MSNLPAPNRALAIGAHPDDIEFGAAGTLARWASAGCRVVMAVVTDGSKGTWNPQQDPSKLVTLRQMEQQEAAAILGASEVVHLGHVDGELEYTMELRSEVAKLIRMHRPDIVLSHDPWARYEVHADHRATGWAAVDGAVAARDHLFFPEHGLDHHRPDSLLLWRAAEPDHWEDVQSTLATKVEALLSHMSQHQTTMGNAGESEDQRKEFEAWVTDTAARHGETAGLAAAEAFKLIPL